MNNLWRTFLTIAAFLISSTSCISNASAGWTFVADPDTHDTATNPGYPKNQGASSVAAYVQDLLDLESLPSLIASDDHYTGAPLTGLGDPPLSSMYVLAFHFGAGNDYWSHADKSFDVFYICTAECDNFTLPNTKAVGSYRLYDPPARLTVDGSIPEPATVGLTLLGLVLAAAASQRRKTSRSV